MKRMMKRSLALFLALLMLSSNVMTAVAQPATEAGGVTETSAGDKTKPTESVKTEEESTKPTEGEIPSDDLTETPAESKEETTAAPAESSAPAESEPEFSEESSEAVEEETTTAAETTAAESEEGSSEAASDEETAPEETTETSEESTEAETTEAASDEETTTAASEEETPAEPTEAPEAVYAVSTYCDPEKGGKISISDSEVKEGEDLQFTVSVNEGYVLELVYVNDEEAEASDVNDTETVYHYVVEDVTSDIDIEAHFAEAEEEEAEEGFEAELSMDGITFIVTADAGVLPEGAKARIISLEEAADIDADAVKEEVLDAEGVTEEEEPLYAAYRIELLDAEDEVLSDEDIKGEIKVSISGLESMSEEEASEPSIYKVEASPVPKDSAANADVFSAPNRAPRLMTLEADTDADAEKDLDLVKIGDKTSMGGATLDVAFIGTGISAKVVVRNVVDKGLVLPGGSLNIEGGSDTLAHDHEWAFVEAPTEDAGSIKIQGLDIDYTILGIGTHDADITIDKYIAEYNQDVFNNPTYIKHTYTVGYDTWVSEAEDYVEFYQINVTKSNAYFYIKKAAFAGGASAGNSPLNYEYWGTGYIPLGDAADYEDEWPTQEGWVIVDYALGFIPIYEWQSTWLKKSLTAESWSNLVVYPGDRSNINPTRNNYDSAKYPVLFVDETPYYYEESTAPEAIASDNKYSVEWTIYTIANGAVGENEGQTLAEGTTWHIDGDVVLYSEDEVTLRAYVQNIDTGDYGDGPVMDILANKSDPVDDWIELRDTVVSLDGIKQDGYVIEWYTDPECIVRYTDEWLKEEALDPSNKTTGINIYGKYVSESDQKYTITYDGNGSDGGSVPEDNTEYAAGQEAVLAQAGSMSKTQAKFLGWSKDKHALITEKQKYNEIKNTILDAGDTIVLDSNLILYAVWAEDINNDNKEDYYQQRVIFDLNNQDGASFDQNSLGTDYKISDDRQTVTYVYDSQDESATYNPIGPDVIVEGDTEFADWYKDGRFDDPNMEYEKFAANSTPFVNGLEGVIFIANYSQSTTVVTYTVKYSYDGTIGSNPDGVTDNRGSAAVGSSVTLDDAKAPVVVTYEGESYVRDDSTSILTKVMDANSDNNEFTVNYLKDADGDGIPDKYQVSVTYKVKNGKWDDGTADDKTEKVTLVDSAGHYDENAEVALAAIPAVGNEPNTGYEAGSWDPTPGVVGKDDNEAIYTYSYKEKAAVEILYKAGEGGSVTPTSETVNPVSGTAAGSEAVANANYAFVNWTDKEGNVVGWDAKFVPDKENGVYEADEYTANFALDENQDGIPDEEQKDHVVTLQPYQTSIYFGGNNDNGENNGLPNLEIEVVELDRALISSNINTVTINGHKFSEAETNKSLETFFKPLYVYSDEAGYYHQVNNDTEALGHDVKTVIAVLDSALAAFEGKGDYEARDGFVYNKTTNRYVTINSYNPGRADVNSFGINANDANGQPVDYFVKVASGNLIVREVTNDAATVIREVVDTEEQAVAINAADDQAVAVPGEGAVQFLTNGDDKREQADPDDVKLLVDDVKDTDNRRTLLADKAFTDAYGMTSAEAKAQGYDSELKFLDLVDTQNGNAWVKSITGTYVYWPYPDGTDKNTEFKLVHFEGLDRETDYNGADAVAGAIADAPIKDHEDLLMEKTDEGIKFFTSGDLAFSPFMLMWDTDSNQSGTDTPSTGGGTSSTPTGSGDATPSGPVSVQQSGNSKGYYYTAGLHGNWVHMDNVDMNTPLDEPVPAGATAVDFPEWHRWRFYLSSGVMLDNQWAHIENPYAVGDQPRSGWFYFDHDGLMRYGWYLDTRSGDWYYMHSESDGMLGTMMTGWHYDSHDNRWYYLDPQSGAMKTGWQNIGGKWYYFNPTPFGETWSLDHSTSVWRFNGNTVRPYGSMYQNEVTPDGYKVGEDGAWIQ